MAAKWFRRKVTAALFIVLLCCLYVETNASPKPEYWPTHGYKTSIPEKQGVNPEPLIEMLETIIRDGVDIDSISIIRNGYLIADFYMYPFQKNTRHIIHSCTKSITSTLIGIAVENGYIAGTEQHMVDFFPGRTIYGLDDRKRSITLAHLLTMSSGLETKDNLMNHGWHGLYAMQAANDWIQYILDRPMAETPGFLMNIFRFGSFFEIAVCSFPYQKSPNLQNVHQRSAQAVPPSTVFCP